MNALNNMNLSQILCVILFLINCTNVVFSISRKIDEVITVTDKVQKNQFLFLDYIF